MGPMLDSTDPRHEMQETGEPTALLPVGVRRWVQLGMGVLILTGIYLASVRGGAILYDLRDAVAWCF